MIRLLSPCLKIVRKETLSEVAPQTRSTKCVGRYRTLENEIDRSKTGKTSQYPNLSHFLQCCQHDNSWTSVFKNHPPEVVHCFWFWSWTKTKLMFQIQGNRKQSESPPISFIWNESSQCYQLKLRESFSTLCRDVVLLSQSLQKQKIYELLNA
jgi:hypothetical protein